MINEEIALEPSPSINLRTSGLTTLRKSLYGMHNKCFEYLKVDGWKSNYESVNLMLRHLSRKCGSEASRQGYLRCVYAFCTYTELDPDKLVKLPKKVIEGRMQDFIDQFNNGNRSLRYINNTIQLLRTFFKVNGFKGNRELEIEAYHMPARYRKVQEYIPGKNEIYLMADSAGSLRNRTLILMLYGTGLRNSTLRALLVKDVEEELSRGISNILVPVYPEMKLIDPYACKGNIPYFMFANDEATQSLRLYLRERKEKYGIISGREPLFTSEYNQINRDNRRLKTMSPRQLQHVVKTAAANTGLSQWRQVKPKCLRTAFETVLHSELVDGGRLDPKIQEFFMGHILPGSEDAYFDRTKVEMLRAEYSKLNFGRVIVENKFKVLRMAVARAFEGSGVDPDKVMEEYIKMRQNTLR
ncbi:MAG: tyrosine-type recombinase/integrase [Candidatus Bathyarchaeia archaeon]